MKAKLTIFFYVALLPSIIYAKIILQICSKNVRQIAKEGGLIEGIFQPTREKPLGIIDRHSNSFAYRDILCPIPKVIAMKFTPNCDPYKSYVEREYQMYSYLNATGVANVERYGIPSVYYYGIWKQTDFIMMGITLLDQRINDLKKLSFFKNDLNILIVLRDFILSSKYMHRHGVRHDWIAPKNIMIRQHRSFLIDFTGSWEMKHRNDEGARNFASRRAYNIGPRCPKDDWEGFLYTICYSIDVKFEWMNRDHGIEGLLKRDTKKTIEIVKNIQSETLRNVLVKFAEHVFDDDYDYEREFGANVSKRFPDYNGFYELVDSEIEKLKSPKSEPAMFTWLSRSDREKAKDDLCKNPIPNIITDIEEPNELNFSTLKYPDVDFDKFTSLYKDWDAKKSASEASSFLAQDPTFEKDKRGKYKMID